MFGVVYMLHLGDHDYRYVGVTKRSIAQRFKEHETAARNGFNRPLYHWMRKHFGFVTYSVIEICDSEEELLLAERKWIATLQRDRLLNLNDGGRGSLNPSPETRAKYSFRARRENLSEETLARMRANALKMTPATKLMISRKLKEHNRLNPRSVETRMKISAVHKKQNRVIRNKIEAATCASWQGTTSRSSRKT